ncbi:MAG: glycine cleavage system aminomethyltransferase GcvT, partial [Betaproteobacteria bacterium]|nr:glycine cleavage system aminomethyltransferase GcvT [Betaproteobacteria bacterium]
IQKVRRTGGTRAGGFPGAEKILAQLDAAQTLTQLRIGLIAQERVPVREHVEIHNASGQRIGEVTSGLLSPSVDQPIAMAYLPPSDAAMGHTVYASVRGKAVPMVVSPMPFHPTRYYRG